MNEREIEKRRMNLWVNTVVAVAGAANSTSSDSPIDWADKALKAFDERFKAEAVKVCNIPYKPDAATITDAEIERANRPPLFRAGDVVFSKSLQKRLILACDEVCGELLFHSRAELSLNRDDCLLRIPATDEFRLEILKDWSIRSERSKDGRVDFRVIRARKQLKVEEGQS